MTQYLSDRLTIRRYLLAQLPEDKRQELEELLLASDPVFEELLVIEDELIDEYLRDQLTGKDRTAFETHFLASPERQQQLDFGRDFLKYVSLHLEPQLVPPARSSGLGAWREWIVSPARIAIYAVVVIAIGLGSWQIFLRQSDVDKGLVALNEAYREQRSIEARLTRQDYAPFSVTRSGDSAGVDVLSLNRAERILLDAVAEHPSPQALHALGKLYLAQRKFDLSIQHLERALAADLNNALIHADLGAALLEKGRAERVNEPDKSAASFARSLHELTRALELNDLLLEAKFNRALLHQELTLRRQAVEDWKKYLERDPASLWAVEAKRNLDLISQRSIERETPAQLLNAFVVAFQRRDNEAAWRILSQNKEMITGRFIPQQLVKAYLTETADSRPDNAEEFLQALVYAGDLEIKNARDPYVADVAAFYGRAPKVHLDLLARAQEAVRVGYGLCAKARFGEALESFRKAQDLFARTGNEWEIKLIDYWVGYCLNQEDQIGESNAVLRSLAEYCRTNNYQWLSGQANCWIGINYAELGDHSNSIRHYNRALAVVEQIADNYNHQKILSQLASQYNQVGQPERALLYSWRSLRLADSAYPGARQLWRNYLYITRTFIALKLYAAAEAFCNEMLYVALNDVKEDDMIQYSYHYLGEINGGLKKYEVAIKLTAQSIAIADSLPGRSAARKQGAYSRLQLAHIKRQAGRYAEALSDYDDAIKTFDQMELGAYEYDALKGRLLCNVALKSYQEIEAELPIVLKQFDKYRLKIREEQNLNTFFDREHDVYDIAIDHAYMQGEIQRAFDYSETSRARSLLATLRNPESPNSRPRHESGFTPETKPMGLSEIQSQIPPNVQVLQYAVLKDKTLIWLITRESVLNEISPHSEEELERKIFTYLDGIRKVPAGDREDLKIIARDLYSALVAPIADNLDRNKVVCIVPDKAISLLPFSALISTRSGKYLISELVLSSSPSLNVFIRCSEAAMGRASNELETLISIGNPSFSSEDFPGLADLPAAAIEARGISKYYRAREFIGPDALREKIQPEMRNADIIHFAGHYLADDRDPMLSRLVLARNREAEGEDDGSLTAREIVGRERLKAKLVVLSACQTGGGKYYKGEGVISMARAFLGTGIPLVVASQWAVDSQATANLMMKFHQYRSREVGLSTVAALARAQRDMLGELNGAYRDPYYWAAFIPIGGYAEF